MNVRRRVRRRLTGFYTAADEWRVISDPDGPPTGRQLLRLNAAGMLELVDPGTAHPITKAEAAAAIEEAT